MKLVYRWKSYKNERTLLHVSISSWQKQIKTFIKLPQASLSFFNVEPVRVHQKEQRLRGLDLKLIAEKVLVQIKLVDGGYVLLLSNK